MGDIVDLTHHLILEGIESLLDDLEDIEENLPMDGFVDVMISVLLRQCEATTPLYDALAQLRYEVGVHTSFLDENTPVIEFAALTQCAMDPEFFHEKIRISAYACKPNRYANSAQYLEPVVQLIRDHVKKTREFYWLFLVWVINDLSERGFELNALILGENTPFRFLRFISNATVVEIRY